MDFTEMPDSLGYNYILVVVDQFSKEVVFVLCTKEETAYSTAELFRDHVWCQHGLPSTVVSDHESVFASNFLGELYIGNSRGQPPGVWGPTRTPTCTTPAPTHARVQVIPTGVGVPTLHGFTPGWGTFALTHTVQYVRDIILLLLYIVATFVVATFVLLA